MYMYRPVYIVMEVISKERNIVYYQSLYCKFQSPRLVFVQFHKYSCNVYSQTPTPIHTHQTGVLQGKNLTLSHL